MPTSSQFLPSEAVKTPSLWWETVVWHRKLSSVLFDNLERWGVGGGVEAQEGEDICVYIADSFHCTEEGNTTL